MIFEGHNNLINFLLMIYVLHYIFEYLFTITKEIDQKRRQGVGFAVGSWLLSSSKNIPENIEALRRAMFI